ncbi:Histone-lysine N-methyltransferase, H3 lysine-9 specific [Penicillium digitatum]|uniref:Histone-lysine N-methyltransferase, H3 lysine-9 specific n=1 Tax=Penicillium digitatum TaxID=36651 RepID=A0A7T7BP17_PENDI|nr:Histone-lysine N-methyltransferase, H3 lysine-9 specific [Penicillium digitatum]
MAGRVPLGSGAIRNRVLIDLTDETEPDDSKMTENLVQGKLPFVAALAYRSPTVPLKRKSLVISDDISDSSLSDVHRSTQRARLSHAYHAPYTPSPLPAIRPSQISVVIPSSTPQQKRENAIAQDVSIVNGMNAKFFPITDEEERVAKAAYSTPKSRVDRRSIPLSFKSSSALIALNQPPPTQSTHLLRIRHTLDEKLKRINGPTVIPTVDSPQRLAKLADNFEFVNSYQYRAGVKRIPDDSDFNIGCACTETGGCDRLKCDCLSKEEDSEDRIVPYEICESNPKLTVATKSFLRRKAIIYECNSRCGCGGQRCWNHVVQKGRTIRLEIFDTGSRGFGLRSPDLIRRGQFIDLYLGEVITKAEADERENLTDGSHTQSYLFSLDWYVKDDDDEEKNMKVIDGRKFGSATRFMNHSCNPNCKIVPVCTTNHADEYLYNLAFFANRDISPGTELTFDYNQGEENITPRKIDPEAVPCLCGESKCRGQLWPNKRKGQGAKP